MGIFKERERKQPDIEQRAEGISPLTIERKEVVTPTTTVFNAQVTDQGQPLIETPENKKLTLKIPKPQLELQTQAKGSIDEAASWWARFWLRLIEMLKKPYVHV